MSDLEAGSSGAVVLLSASTPAPPPGAPGTPPPGAPPPPGGPWTPAPQPSRGPRSPVPFILAGAGVVIVILVVVLVVVLVGGGGDDDKSTSERSTSPSATSSDAGLTRAEQALSTHVPEKIRATCVGKTASADPTPGQVAVLECDPNDPATYEVGYTQFDSPGSMNAVYQRLLDAAPIAPDSGGSCSDGELGEGSYNNGEGRSVCFMHANGGAYIWWTDAELNILGTARNRAGDIGALGAWWSKGPSGPV